MDRYITKKALPQVESLDPKGVEVYKVMGDWLKVNREAIYGTVRNPLDEKPEWGNISASKDGKTLYLHILEWPKSEPITVKGRVPKRLQPFIWPTEKKRVSARMAIP